MKRILIGAGETGELFCDLQRRVMERLPGPERKLLAELIMVYPAELRNDELARRAGYEPGGGCARLVWRNTPRLGSSRHRPLCSWKSRDYPQHPLCWGIT